MTWLESIAHILNGRDGKGMNSIDRLYQYDREVTETV